MTRHGKFDAVALLHRSAHTSVWSARPAGAAAAPPNHCLKLVELTDHELADRDATAAEHLLVGAALQQAMADKSDGWAPVYELGSDDGTTAFYVTKLYPRSAQSMIDARDRLSSVELRTVLLGVVDALIDLDGAYHRPHANLKPSNVLVGDAVRPGQVVLSDPGALAENVPSLTRAPDPKAVGQLLYALVTHRPHTGARWPLAQGDAWRSLGSSGKQWFALCESLVNPFSDSVPDLNDLRARIAAIRTSRRRTPRAAMAVPVLAAAAVAVYACRHRIPQWYQAADHQLAMLTRSSKPDRGRSPVGPVLPAAGPSRPTTAPPAGPGNSPKPDVSATLAGLTMGPSVPSPLPPSASGPMTDGPMPTVVAPPARPRALVDAPAVQAVPPARPAPVAPTTAPAAPPDDAAAVNRRALAVVRDWSPPDFRSDAAQAAFEDGRRQFLAAHASDDPSVTLAQWEAVSTRLRLAGDAYPPVDVATTAGWPVGVADQVAARREQLLGRAVSAAFDQASFDPLSYHRLTDAVRSAVSAAAVARKALAGGGVPAARSSVADFRDAVRHVAAADTGVADAMTASAPDLDRLAAVDATADRDKLLATADDESAPLAVRVDAWLRAGTITTPKPWPADFATAAADQARGVELAGLLHDQLATAAEKQVMAEADRRLAGFMASLRGQAAVAAAATGAVDPQYADLVARCPAWFRFDAALATARATPASAIKPGQRQALLDLAAAANVPAAKDVTDLLHAGDKRAARSLAEAGPASTGAWRMHAGSTRDHCTYDATSGTEQTLEFLRVHVSPADAGADGAGLDCYLCTTDVPVSLMSHLLADDPAALSAAHELNRGPAAPPGPRVWRFADDDPTNPVVPDVDAYRRCFGVSPTDRLPVQLTTPQLALYLARRAGCRLPSAVEWRAALDAARHADDPIARGFATQGWKLRTPGNYSALLANAARDADLPPDGGGFLPASVDPAHDRTWSAAALAKLGGRAAGDPPVPLGAWPLSTLETADGFGFRPVAGTDDYAGVFHDLVGNVAQLVLDVPATLAEQLDAKGSTAAADVRAWFTPDRLTAVAVVGGSAVSPPTVDPTQAYPLPAGGATAFADVGFRLAFTDPTARPAEAWTALRRMPFATAP